MTFCVHFLNCSCLTPSVTLEDDLQRICSLVGSQTQGYPALFINKLCCNITIYKQYTNTKTSLQHCGQDVFTILSTVTFPLIVILFSFYSLILLFKLQAQFQKSWDHV